MSSKSEINLSQTRKAILARKRRAKTKEKKRHDTFICDYILTKYWNIYEEANTAYHKLAVRYPEKLNITKTYYYLKWKREVSRVSQTMNRQPFQSENSDGEAPVLQPFQSENSDGEAPVPQPFQPENSDGEAPVPQPSQPENSDGEAPVPQPSQPENSDGEAPVPQPLVQVEIGDMGEANLDQMEAVINNIIREFEQDDQIMRFLPQIEQSELDDQVFW